jgi:DNA end-binding protein Ku
MAATVWKGYITFGLISIPVRLFSAARDERIEFHQMHEVCHTRLKQQLYCPHCKRVVERSEIIKGYEVAKNRYVFVTDEEIKAVAPPSSDAMEIVEVVKLTDVDPIYFESSYYVVPEPAGSKAYFLLFDSMKKIGLAAVAKLAMHRREYIVVIRSADKGLTLHTMYYEYEVRAVPEYEKLKPTKVSPKELEMAERLLKGLEGKFDPAQFHDEYQERLKKLVEAKKKGRTIEATPPKKPAQVVDLMDALQRSLKAHPKPSAKAHPRKLRKAS